MSRTVMQDIVIPIVARVLAEDRYLTPLGAFNIRDPALEEFLEEELRRRFGVIGANDCQNLREQPKEAMRNDPYAFDFVIRQLLEKYVKIATKIRSAKKLKEENGPPDRFLELRRKYLRRYNDSQTA